MLPQHKPSPESQNKHPTPRKAWNPFPRACAGAILVFHLLLWGAVRGEQLLQQHMRLALTPAGFVCPPLPGQTLHPPGAGAQPGTQEQHRRIPKAFQSLQHTLCSPLIWFILCFIGPQTLFPPCQQLQHQQQNRTQDVFPRWCPGSHARGCECCQAGLGARLAAAARGCSGAAGNQPPPSWQQLIVHYPSAEPCAGGPAERGAGRDSPEIVGMVLGRAGSWTL